MPASETSQKHLTPANENDYHSLKGVVMKILFVFLSSLFSLYALAADAEVALVIRDHRFEPAEIRVPAGQKIKLVVHNQDTTPEEFESHELNREKLIAPNTKVSIFVGPLGPGRYPFFGEFHEKTARGAIIAE
jgi:plastocyanin